MKQPLYTYSACVALINTLYCVIGAFTLVGAGSAQVTVTVVELGFEVTGAFG